VAYGCWSNAEGLQLNAPSRLAAASPISWFQWCLHSSIL
jgi:hypothetical protein